MNKAWLVPAFETLTARNINLKDSPLRMAVAAKFAHKLDPLDDPDSAAVFNKCSLLLMEQSGFYYNANEKLHWF
jgi:hypothetical protein